MSIPFSRPDTYTTFNAWMADAHSLMARIQHEIDGAEVGGCDPAFIRTEALGELIEMTEAFSHLLKLGDQAAAQMIADCYYLAGGEEELSPSEVSHEQ
jgi:hypothetical protein